jgi:hypothetical protein
MKEKLQVTVGGTSAGQSTQATIGMDLGDRWSRYCVVGRNGEIVEEDRVRTTMERLDQRFGKMQATRIIVEAGTHSSCDGGAASRPARNEFRDNESFEDLRVAPDSVGRW